MAFEIISRTESDRQWTNDNIGTPNEFTTEEEAREAIEQLRRLGEDWAAAEYDVREIGR